MRKYKNLPKPNIVPAEEQQETLGGYPSQSGKGEEQTPSNQYPMPCGCGGGKAIEIKSNVQLIKT